MEAATHGSDDLLSTVAHELKHLKQTMKETAAETLTYQFPLQYGTSYLLKLPLPLWIWDYSISSAHPIH